MVVCLVGQLVLATVFVVLVLVARVCVCVVVEEAGVIKEIL